MMKKLLSMLLVTLMALTMLSGLAIAEDKVTIGFCNYNKAESFPGKLETRMIEMTKELGWDIDITENLGDSEKVMQSIDSYILKEVDAIVCFWQDAAFSYTIQAKCDEAGIPLVLLGCEPDGSVVVTADNAEFGAMCGIALANAAIEKWDGKIDSILAVEVAANGELNEKRMNGAVNAIKETLGEGAAEAEVVFVDGDKDQLSNQQVITDAFTAHPYWEKTLIICFNEPHCGAGAVQSVIAAEKQDQVLVAIVQGFGPDAEYWTETYDWFVGAGEHFAVSFASKILEKCQDYLNGETVEFALYYVPLTFVDKTNVDQYDAAVD